MKPVIGIIVMFVFLVLILPAVLSLGIREIPGDSQPSLDYTGKVIKGVVPTQFFVSRYNNLSGLGMTIKNPNLANKEDLTLKVFLEEREIRSVTINGRNIPGGDFIKFRFTPVENSKGKMFSFSLSTPSVENQDSFELYYSRNILPDNQKLIINESEVQGGVSFVSFYQPGGKLSLMQSIYSEWLGRIWQDKAFSVVYLLILATGVILLIWTPKRIK